jgi:hypothetical protein
MFKRKMIVEMPDNSKWEIPLKIVEDNMKENGIDDEYLDNYDDFDFIDWAQNNMNWSDVLPFAKMVSSPVVDFEDGWANGEKEIHKYEDAPQETAEASALRTTGAA